MSFVSLNIEYFPDPTRGVPVYKGYVYVGEPDTDPEIPGNQVLVTLRLSDGSTVPTIQPLRTGAGGTVLYNGSPAQVLVEGNYSLKVLNEQEAQVYYVGNAIGLPAGTAAVVGLGVLLVNLKAFTVLSNGMIAITAGRSDYGDGGDGTWNFSSSDLSAEVAADPLSGLFAAPDTDSTGASGAWVRQYSGAVSLLWFVSNTTPGVTDMQPAGQAAADLSGYVYAPPGFEYKFSSVVTLIKDFHFIAHGAIITGAGLTSEKKLFINNTGGTIRIEGGTYRSALMAFNFTAADNIYVNDAHFNDVAHGVSMQATIAGEVVVESCTFDDLEMGVVAFTHPINSAKILNSRFTNIEWKAGVSRVEYPMDKEAVAGVYIKSNSGPGSVIITGNFVDGVTAAPVIPIEPTCVGLGVSLAAHSQVTPLETSSCIISNNIVRNLYDPAYNTDGLEGIMGRAHSVIVEGNLLYNAGNAEGMIYSKGTVYHKVLGNTIEASLDYAHISTCQGLISTGVDSDISNNKFVNLFNPIKTRSADTLISGNEFFNDPTATGSYKISIQVSLLAGTSHKRTVIQGNKFSPNTGDGIALSPLTTDSTYGDFIIKNNSFMGARLGNFQAVDSLVLEDNYILRDPLAVQREIVVFVGAMEAVFFRGNTIMSFTNANIPDDSRVITGNTLFTPNLYIESNVIKNGYNAFRLRDANYETLVLKDNIFLDVDIPINGILGANYDVYNRFVMDNNLGAAGIQSSNSILPTTGTWVRGDTIKNLAPVVGGFVGWVCTTGGTFGATDPIFKTYGAISA